MPSVEKTIPVLFVQDAKRAVAWYTRVLGFRVRFEEEEGEYVGLECGGAQIHLAQRGAPQGVRLKGAFQLRLTGGIDEYVAAIVATGEPLAAPLNDMGDMRGATVRDPDGNDVYIGQLVQEPVI
jgi:catechol 2,3-dioxygenase-like lactoylglutathione lyase family enzyme